MYVQESEEFERLTGPFRAIQVLTVSPSKLARIVSFNDPRLFAMFGLAGTMARSA